jgi:hypothetical protein
MFSPFYIYAYDLGNFFYFRPLTQVEVAIISSGVAKRGDSRGVIGGLGAVAPQRKRKKRKKFVLTPGKNSQNKSKIHC